MVKKKILIVDDDATLASEVKLALEETGQYEVHYETKALRSLGVAEAYKPDIILMDLLIPDMSGAEASRKLKENPKTMAIPVVFFTILVSQETVAESKMMGGTYFLAKPSTVDEIIDCIEQAYRETRSAA